MPAVAATGQPLKWSDALGELYTAGNILDRPPGESCKLADLLDDMQRHYLRRAMSEASGVKT